MPKGRDILGTPPWKTKAATPAYRSGWDEVFDSGRPRVARPDGGNFVRGETVRLSLDELCDMGGEQHLPDQGASGHDTPGDDGDLHDREVFDG